VKAARDVVVILLVKALRWVDGRALFALAGMGVCEGELKTLVKY
jgi:hypothetical protein